MPITTVTGRTPLLLGLACLGSWACAGPSPPPGDIETAELIERDRVLLTVDNQNFSDATIYARWNGERRHLGTVTGKSRRTFELEWRSHRILIEVDFIAGGHYRSNAMDVARGDHLKFIIGPS